MYTKYPFRFGTILMEFEAETIHRLLCTPTEEEIDVCLMETRTSFTDSIRNQIDSFLDGKQKSFDFSYELQGTTFQMDVWNTLLQIPYGETRTYQQIAKMIGRPKASRAVGMAIHLNPIHLVVPCHRVIGKDGSLTGYAGGLQMKQFLLDLERNID